MLNFVNKINKTNLLAQLKLGSEIHFMGEIQLNLIVSSL